MKMKYSDPMKQKDVQQIIDFMCRKMVKDCTAAEYKDYWQIINNNIDTFGRHFVADSIYRDSNAAKLAIWRTEIKMRRDALCLI